MNKSYYQQNQKYSNLLNQGDISNFGVYTSVIKKYLPANGKILDVGCGPGLVVNSLTKEGVDATGIEISRSSLQIAGKGQGKFKLYGGEKIPFPNSSFNIVGSFNVIEHVEDTSLFLNESLRVVKSGGFLVICAPNFLSLTNSYHYRVAGFVRKGLNAAIFTHKLLNYFVESQVRFDKFSPVNRPDFHPDDDATNLINPLDLFKWGKLNNLKLTEYAGSILPSNYPSHYLGLVPFLNLFSGGVLVVFKK